MKSNITNILVLFFLMSFLSCKRNNHIDSFIVSAGSEAFDECYGLATDSKNNIIVSGVFSKQIEFDDTDLNSKIESNGALDFFVAKYTSSGKLLWVKRFGSTSDDEVANICIDEFDNIYVTGYYSSSPDFLKDTTNRSASFLLKLNTNGDKIWGCKLRGTNTSEGISVVAKNGFLYWTSFYNGSLNDSIHSRGLNDICYLKLNYAGNILKEKSFGTKANDQSKDIYISNSNHIFITGYFSSNETEIGSAGIIELDTAFNVLSKTSLYYSIPSEAISIIVDNEGNKYISGSFDAGNNNQDAFLWKLSDKNEEVWKYTFSSIDKDWARGLAFDSLGNIISAVVLNKQAKITNLRDIVSGYGNYDIFFTKLTSDGKMIGHSSFGNSEEEGINKIIIDKQKNLLFCGWFFKTLSINKSSVTSKGGGDVFFAKQPLTSLFQ